MTRAQEPAELRPGLPPVELRRVWRTWQTSHYTLDLISFTEDGMSWAWGFPVCADRYKFDLDRHSTYVGGSISRLSFAPHGASWSEVEALAAKAAEVR
jgi:hypothetical protein